LPPSVDGQRLGAAAVEHAMDRGGRQVEGLTAREAPCQRWSGQRQAFLDDRPFEDSDPGRRDIVVVKAGVRASGPADRPCVDVVVGPDLRVAARRAAVHVQYFAPGLRTASERSDEALQLDRAQLRPRRAGQRRHAATPAASVSQAALAWR
jgi:hypothetical protein